MRRSLATHRSSILAAALAVAAAIAVAAPTAGGQAASTHLQTDARCYLANQVVRVTGSGFTPGATYTVTLDHKTLGTGTVKPDGSVAGTLPSGQLPGGTRLVRRRLQVFDGTLQGRAAFNVTAFRASFQPSAGDPRTLIVHYSVLGIGIGKPPGAVVYVHYADSHGRLKGTLPIGRTASTCGTLAFSKAHRLFPFIAGAGTWQLQFDLNPAYSPHRRPRIVRAVTIG